MAREDLLWACFVEQGTQELTVHGSVGATIVGRIGGALHGIIVQEAILSLKDAVNERLLDVLILVKLLAIIHDARESHEVSVLVRQNHQGRMLDFVLDLFQG